MAMIQTPDQRVRVFISSTMRELSAERAAVRKSVARLRLTPVLFELGARAHPPRELYLAYLRQSHVFLGIYYEQYGWIAPGETVSGLEDEFLASGGKPRLVYVKSPAPNRDPRLAEMLQRIASEGLSYRPFSTPSELAKLVVDDLAVLLSERFGTADGLDVTEVGAAGPGAVQAPVRRGTTTFLFTDVEGSTRLLQQAREAYGTLLEHYRRLVRAAFTAHDGRDVDTRGDSFLVAFPSPGGAVVAAGEAQQALAAHSWPHPFHVRVRIGLHSGEATEADGSYLGVAVHRAARIAAAGHGGQTLLSEATAALVRHELPTGWVLHDLGDHWLKDFPAATRLYQLNLPGLPTDFPPLRTRASRLPIPSTPGSFIGRESDVAALTTLLRDRRTRLVTLTGPGGIGKTRLALEAAHAVVTDLPGGVVFVSLAAVTDPSLVLGAVADAVGARREPGGDVLTTVATAVGSDRTLLVLDNVEQVQEAAGDLAELLERVPAAVLLVTSRAVLRLRTERQFPVRPLADSAAIRLFAERAAAVRPEFYADQDDAIVAQICRRLDGLPLAIELAAARIRVLTPRALLARLGERLDVLGSGPVDLPSRQRTLRATLDWSFGLLQPHEQALFARLGVFAGGWTLEAAEGICGRPGEPDVLETLTALVDASLVVSSGDFGSEPRFSMLETVRVYAGERLAASADWQQTRQRHAAWMVALTENLLHARGGNYRLARQRLDTERANLRAAVLGLLEPDDVAPAALLIRNATAYLQNRGAETELAAWLDAALEKAGGASPPVRGRLLVLRAVVAMVLGELASIPALLSEGEPLLSEDPDYEFDRALAAVVGIQHGFSEGLQEAARAADAALAGFTALGMEIGQATMHLAGGDLALAMGDLEQAASHYRSAISLAETLGEDGMLGRALSMLGLSQLTEGDLAAGRRSVLQGAEVNRRAGEPTSMAYSLEGLAAVALAEGRPSVAAYSLGAATAARDHNALPLTPALPPLVDQLIVRAREQLKEDAFVLATADGRGCSLHEALDRALQELSQPAGT